jgi:signal transduction histidine kinase
MLWSSSMDASTMDADRVTAGQRARFQAVRRRVFLEMRDVGARWRSALIIPFHVLVIVILATRGFPKDRLLIQIVAFATCIAALSVGKRIRSRVGSRLALSLGGTALLVTIGNTGGLASPLVLGVVPFLFAIATDPELDKKRRIFMAKFIVGFGLMAWLSRHICCSLAGPLSPEGQNGTTASLFASQEYVLISLGSASLTVLAVYFMGKGMTTAYERIALELAARREELCDENEGRTRALEGIAARLAHEVKNPLAAIKGLSTHMARSSEDPKVKERLTIVAAEAERLQEIVDGFLSFSRGLDELTVAPTKPYDIARELSLLLETRAADAGVSIEVRGSRELTLNADGKKLRQALLNLVLNAMHASSKGSIVTLEVAKSCSDGAAVIRVMDKGAGMTPDVIARIERPYFTTKEGGSGLGIAVARGIIEQHGGSLRFESTSGRGTTATVVLPACASKAQDKKGHLKLPGCREWAARFGHTSSPHRIDEAEVPTGGETVPTPAPALGKVTS